MVVYKVQEWRSVSLYQPLIAVETLLTDVLHAVVTHTTVAATRRAVGATSVAPLDLEICTIADSDYPRQGNSERVFKSNHLSVFTSCARRVRIKVSWKHTGVTPGCDAVQGRFFWSVKPSFFTARLHRLTTCCWLQQPKCKQR